MRGPFQLILRAWPRRDKGGRPVLENCGPAGGPSRFVGIVAADATEGVPPTDATGRVPPFRVSDSEFPRYGAALTVPCW